LFLKSAGKIGNPLFVRNRNECAGDFHLSVKRIKR
jgi:hypothetical protein